MKKKRILFCCFTQKDTSYLPTDIGYIVAILQQTLSFKYDFEILHLNYEKVRDEEADRNETRDYIRRDVDLIAYHNPDAVFLFTENVLWSKVFALGRATKVIRELRDRQPKLFIGLQSNKIQKNEIEELLKGGSADCFIGGDPENTFLFLDKILAKKFVPGVQYDVRVLDEGRGCPQEECPENKPHVPSESLDYIPSPYLCHVFDNYIQAYQARNGNSFRAFLVSSRGCRFGCHYCFRSTKFEKVQCFSVKRFYDELEYLLNNFKVQRFFVLDDAFLYSGTRLKEFEAEYRGRLLANPRLQYIDLFVMARPETMNEEIVEMLSNLKVKNIQFGLQSVNPDIQHYMRRTMDVIYFKKIKGWLRKYNITMSLDIVVGLPGDTAHWMKETLRFALLLEPYFIQIKQLYLNPNTLFQVNQAKHAIEIEKMGRDFNSPYVVKANNIDDAYFEETNDFIMKQIEANPDVAWKYLTKKQIYFGSWTDDSRDEKHEK